MRKLILTILLLFSLFLTSTFAEEPRLRLLRIECSTIYLEDCWTYADGSTHCELVPFKRCNFIYGYE